MSKLFLWCDNVISDVYDEKLNDDPEYVIDKLHDDILTCRERIAGLEAEIATIHRKQFNSILGDTLNDFEQQLKEED